MIHFPQATKLPTILYKNHSPCCVITYVQLVHYKLATESHRTETIVQEKDTEIERLQALVQVLEVRGLYLQLIPC